MSYFMLKKGCQAENHAKNSGNYSAITSALFRLPAYDLCMSACLSVYPSEHKQVSGGFWEVQVIAMAFELDTASLTLNV